MSLLCLLKLELRLKHSIVKAEHRPTWLPAMAMPQLFHYYTSYGANKEAKDSDGRTPLEMAILCNQSEAVTRLFA